MGDPFEREGVRWRRASDAEFPYEAEVDGGTWRVRVNDWPDDPTVYTLILADGQELDFDDWPPQWNRPAK